MQKKFNLFDDVMIFNQHTGKNDIKAHIVNYSFNKKLHTYFYDARDKKNNLHHIEERLIEKYRETSDMIIECAKKTFRESHVPSDKTYEPYAVIGSLSAAYDSLLKKFERMEEKYLALRSRQQEESLVL